MDIQDYFGKHLYFIGIGGSSMSGLARLMSWHGCKVSGSDRTANHKTDALKEIGVTIYVGHEGKNVAGSDLVIYSAAIPETNPERVFAKENNIPQIERCTLIGLIMAHYGNAIAISGTHGKTTTTAMMAQVFMAAGEDPTIHIGGEFPALGGSTRLGEGETFICEACEYNASFLSFLPDQAVILNIDEDHLDFYKDIDDITNAFARFARLVPKDGCVFGCGDDPRVYKLLESLECDTCTFGLQPQNMIRAEEVSYDEDGCAHFTATYFGHPLCEIQMKVGGEHNLKDALAVIAVANRAQLPMSVVAQALSDFSGVERRYDLTSVTDGVKVYTDYGHNPTETATVLGVARKQAKKRLWAVLQPHTYSRTKTLFHQWLECFDDADEILVTDICGAREVDPGDINSGMLVDAMLAKGLNAHLTPSFDDTEAYLRAHWQPGDSVVTLGCGDIYLLNEQIAAHGDTPKA